MEYLTGFKEDLQANIVTYGANIAEDTPMFAFPELRNALLPDFYPSSRDMIRLGGELYSEDNWEYYWEQEERRLLYSCKSKILGNIDQWEYKRIALFGFAPMPLLVRLGTLLNNKYDVVVYQKQRSGGWSWPDTTGTTEYIVKRPETTCNSPILVLSLSYSIAKRVHNERPDGSIWEITIDTPKTDFLRSKQMLYDFGRKVELVLDEITKICKGQTIDLYLAVPVACAIEFGRVWMKKANAPLNIYDFDQRFDNKDKLALTIKNI